MPKGACIINTARKEVIHEEELVKVIKEKSIKSIAIPPLGAGNGGLDWNKVKSILD